MADEKIHKAFQALLCMVISEHDKLKLYLDTMHKLLKSMSKCGPSYWPKQMGTGR
jgi:hypothetical protein